MKYLIVLGVVACAIWLWRHNREQAKAKTQRPTAPPRTPKPPNGPMAMTRCHHCGTHLPQADAVQGMLGHYCDHEHRRLGEG